VAKQGVASTTNYQPALCGSEGLETATSDTPRFLTVEERLLKRVASIGRLNTHQSRVWWGDHTVLMMRK